ncbi:hypothetical protein PHLCEN_2v9902 [Hermanssonia centrifuga]|uniref:Uncharacterized protein n=1 Tax=Hermanssonia centrifuga TaxID=98765 RepID=A0A2R6NQB8_9APHY|nr:hypothetical protein PHLCEN_2v9902 [Hermanssonia centrifuga]
MLPLLQNVVLISMHWAVNELYQWLAGSGQILLEQHILLHELHARDINPLLHGLGQSISSLKLYDIFGTRTDHIEDEPLVFIGNNTNLRFLEMGLKEPGIQWAAKILARASCADLAHFFVHVILEGPGLQYSDDGGWELLDDILSGPKFASLQLATLSISIFVDRTKYQYFPPVARSPLLQVIQTMISRRMKKTWARGILRVVAESDDPDGTFIFENESPEMRMKGSNWVCWHRESETGGVYDPRSGRKEHV